MSKKLTIVWNQYEVFFKEGFAPIPSYLIKNRRRLGLTQSENELLNLLFAYGGADGDSRPSVDTLAEDMGVLRRQVNKLLKQLFDKGFIDIIEVFDEETGIQRPNQYDLSPTLDILQDFYNLNHLKEKEARKEKRVKRQRNAEKPHNQYPVHEGQGNNQYIVHEGQGEDVLHGQGEDVLHGQTKRISLKEPLKEFEEEEEIILPVITESHVNNAMNQLIHEWEITNQKTINAALKVASKCKVIGTTDWATLENYVITVVEEKMQKFGKNQKVKQQATSGGKKPVRKEVLAESIIEQQQEPQKQDAAEQEDLKAIQRQLQEEIKQYKKD